MAAVSKDSREIDPQRLAARLRRCRIGGKAWEKTFNQMRLSSMVDNRRVENVVCGFVNHDVLVGR